MFEMYFAQALDPALAQVANHQVRSLSPAFNVFEHFVMFVAHMTVEISIT